jgi:hypothetical protein
MKLLVNPYPLGRTSASLCILCYPVKLAILSESPRGLLLWLISKLWI